MKRVSQIIFEAAFQHLAIKNVQNKKRHDVVCPAHTMPTGVSLLAYRQTSPGNMTESVIWGINTMMSLGQQADIKTNTDNTSGKP